VWSTATADGSFLETPGLRYNLQPDSSASIVSRLRTGRPGFDSEQGLGFVHLATASRAAPGPKQPLIKSVPEALYPRLKWPESEADHSSTSTADVKNAWNYTSCA
jgi:hypothetical protein